MGEWSVGARVAATAAAALILSACAGLPTGGGFGPEQVNFAAGSTLGGELPGRDVEVLHDVFLTAIETGAPDEPASWSGRAARGAVIPGGYLLAGLRPDPADLLAAPPGLEITHVLETELGLYVLTRNSNVRRGPGTDRDILEVLPSGTGVDVVGRVVDRPWMLVAIDDEARGYIAQKLLIRAPGSELLLAGGPRRRPHLCREFTQRLELYGRLDEWSGVACNRGDGWRLEIPENAPVRLF
ncbi:MAG: SH3 domain-containing protein [Parvularculaceae bacterium]